MKYLQESVNYYKTLLNKHYVFDTDAGRIVVVFSEANFCHLIGLQHCGSNFPMGQNGWDSIENGEITDGTIKGADKNFYKYTLGLRASVLIRIEDIFKNAKVIKRRLGFEGKTIDFDFSIYDAVNKEYYILTLFIDKETRYFCVGATLLKFKDNDMKLINYLPPSDKDLQIRDYFVDETCTIWSSNL